MTTVPISIPGPAQINVTLTSTGPRGATGPAGGSEVTATAGETLSAGRVVVIIGGQAFYFQPATSAHLGMAYGITTTSATTGNQVSIQIGGVVTDGAFSALTEGQVWVGANGVVQSALPGSGILQKAGIYLGSDNLKIDFSIQVQQN